LVAVVGLWPTRQLLSGQQTTVASVGATIDRLPDFLIRQHQAGISIHQRSVDPLDSERQNFFVKRPTVAKRRKPHKELQIKIAAVLQGISAFRRTMKLNSNSHSSRSTIIAGHFSCSWQNP